MLLLMGHSCVMSSNDACRFHELREHHPKIASKRKVNETIYASMGVRTGWFCGAQPLRESIATIKVRPATFPAHACLTLR